MDHQATDKNKRALCAWAQANDVIARDTTAITKATTSRNAPGRRPQNVE
jgi:hypothetical protein